MYNVLVLGLGKIGSLISILLASDMYDTYKVYGMDKELEKPLWVGKITEIELNVMEELTALEDFIKDKSINIIISALPYFCNITIADLAHAHGVHYFDLTEDVNVTKHIMQLGETAKSILMPQCGLAPGFINIVANNLMEQFDEVYDSELRVGALPQITSNALKYSLTWSTNGLVNEYGNACEAIYNGEQVKIAPLTDLESLVIDGVEYEAFSTSGGLGTLTETYKDSVRNLNYKTVRYPGHCKLIKFLMDDLRLNDKRDVLERILDDALPTTFQDVVLIKASVTGIKNGKFLEKNFVHKVYPNTFFEKEWTAIQLTTAGGVCAAVDNFFGGYGNNATGFVRQEQINFLKYWDNYYCKIGYGRTE